MHQTANSNFDLFDFGIIDSNVSLDELLHTSYMRGKEDMMAEIIDDFKDNLQSAAQSSSLLKLKLKDLNISIIDMFIKIIDFNAFKCLVVVNKDDYFTKDRRHSIRQLSKHINKTNNRINLDFTLMSQSEDIEQDNIISDGYTFKHESGKIQSV